MVVVPVPTVIGQSLMRHNPASFILSRRRRVLGDTLPRHQLRLTCYNSPAIEFPHEL